MTFVNRILSVAVLGAAAVTGLAGTQSSRAAEILFRSMERGQMIAVSGVFSQRSFGGGLRGCQVQVKIDQTADGKVKVSTLEPLSLQGVTTVDDGKTWTTYFPDDKRIIVQESPRGNQPDPRWRINLAEKNYALRAEPGESIAGRKTVTVVAMPKYVEMPTRRYSLDVEKLFMLRLETTDDEGNVSRRFDTKMVSFPDNIRPDTMSINPVGDVRVIKLPGSTSWTSRRYVEDRVGFSPVIPKDLPFGFVVSDRRLTDQPEGSYVALRISDGLVTATVYQWQEGASQPWPTSKRDKEKNGVKMRIIGDLPDGVLSRILESFLKKASVEIAQLLETLSGQAMLQISETHGGSGQKVFYILFRI